MHAALQQAQQQLDDLGPDARVAQGQGVGANEHHGAHDVGGERRTDAHGMAHQDVALQLRRLFWGDQDIFERAKAGGDAVDHLFLGNDGLHRGLRPLDARQGGVIQMQAQRPRPGVGHAHNLGDGERLSIKRQLEKIRSHNR